MREVRSYQKGVSVKHVKFAGCQNDNDITALFGSWLGHSISISRASAVRRWNGGTSTPPSLSAGTEKIKSKRMKRVKTFPPQINHTVSLISDTTTPTHPSCSRTTSDCATLFANPSSPVPPKTILCNGRPFYSRQTTSPGPLEICD